MEVHCFLAVKIVYHHANAHLDWLVSGHQSIVNPSREAILYCLANTKDLQKKSIAKNFSPTKKSIAQKIYSQEFFSNKKSIAKNFSPTKKSIAQKNL